MRTKRFWILLAANMVPAQGHRLLTWMPISVLFLPILAILLSLSLEGAT
jgi:hypothetical protein